MHDTQRLYRERLARYTCAMRGGTPDRIPIRFLMQEAAARYMGVSNQSVACDYNAAFDVTREAAIDLGVDAVMLNAIWSTYTVAKGASWRYLYQPGVDVGLASVNQFGEPEGEEDAFLRADEYDELIADPTRYLLEKWMPRATRRVKPAGAPVDLEHNAALMAGAMQYGAYMAAFGPASAKLREAGIVSANAGMLKAPLDIVGDKFRGYIGSAEDSILRPERLKAACEALMPHLLANAMGGGDPERNVPITLWAHRGCVPFYSQETFDTIFWPTLKPILEGIIAAGHQVLFYAEGMWLKHYKALRELPPGGIIFHCDRDDPAEAKRLLGDRFAISGGMRYDVLARGTPQDVRAHLKALFSDVKPGGGYILDASALMMHDVKPENLREAVAYTMEHGVYSQGHAAPPMGTLENLADIPQGMRPPNTVISWEAESAGYRCLEGDVELVKRQWEGLDAALYNYIWTTVLW